MEFCMLGPLEVLEGGRPIEFGSSRQRTILSMLLFEASRVVPLSRLVDAVWDAEPPVTARNQIHTCIYGLRTRLTSGRTGSAISTRSPGYQISVSDGALDIAVFRSLSSRGLAMADGEPEEAVQFLRGALALWRGPAASGIDSRLVQGIATQLNEDYLNVLDERIDLELKLGRHHDLVGELSALVRQHPLRERTRAQHMLALYRSARQAEALDSYRQIRMIFAEQLGLEPGGELRALQRSILTEDRALSYPKLRKASWATNRELVVPHQLPPMTPDLTGRDSLLQQITSVLSASAKADDGHQYASIVSLQGKAGVGKTALAVHAAHAVRHLYPSGQLFAQLQGPDGKPVSPSTVQRSFLAALGAATDVLPDNAPDCADIYRSLLAERRLLILLDDAYDVSQVAPLIPASPGCAVIVSSRVPLSGLPGVRQFEVDDLDEDASIELLGKILGSKRIRDEASPTRQLARLCAGLPMALRIVAAKLELRRHWAVADMVSRMTDELSRLDELTISKTSLRSTLAPSYEKLGAEARRLFVRLSLLGAAEFGSWVSAPLLDMGYQAARDVLDVLVDARLVEARLAEDHAARFRLHDLVRIYARERLVADEAVTCRANALRRLLECSLALATEARHRLRPGNSPVHHSRAPAWTLPASDLDHVLADPMSWLAREHSALIAAVSEAGKPDLAGICRSSAATLAPLLQRELQYGGHRATPRAGILDSAKHPGKIFKQFGLLV
jgi:DNA-binding SARP family transcriptional activator